MNRIIKFRGKRLDNGEWVYGCLADYFSGSGKCIMPDSYYATKHFGEQDNLGNPILEDEMALGGFILVDPKTVGQFTGLLDKNGKEIYEWDIFSFGKHHPYFIAYENAEFVCYHLNIDDGMGGKLKWGRLSRTLDADMEKYFVGIEVVGNIHDNPELLEGGL